VVIVVVGGSVDCSDFAAVGGADGSGSVTHLVQHQLEHVRKVRQMRA
jgi:hypothetical protein